MSKHSFTDGRGAGNRVFGSARLPTSHTVNAIMPVQTSRFVAPHFPFQPLPSPNGPPPYHFDLSNLLSREDIERIEQAGVLVFHSVGDTGDKRGRQMDFVAALLTEDYEGQPVGRAPAFFYHLGDVVYFAGDIGDYGDCFYETYSEYPGLIVSIPGNHDCQPDDPQDGPVDPNKRPLDGWVQNFMSTDPSQLGSLKTASSRTQMNLPNVYWTFTTPFATIIGLFSNVSETEAELHSDQISWFEGELRSADPSRALIVAIHHPPYSGDTTHSGSSVAERVLFDSFSSTGRYPHLILSGHVHNYQRFTVSQEVDGKNFQIPCVVAGAGGYTRLGRLYKINGRYPKTPVAVSNTLTLESYDQENFGFLRLEVSKTEITGTYLSAPYAVSTPPASNEVDRFVINLGARTVQSTRGSSSRSSAQVSNGGAPRPTRRRSHGD
jgi:acid phosphatase type 7